MCAGIKHSTTARKFLGQFSPHPRWRLKRSFNWANGSTLLLESEETPLVVAADLFPFPLKTQEAKHCETDFPVSTLVTSALMTRPLDKAVTATSALEGDRTPSHTLNLIVFQMPKLRYCGHTCPLKKKNAFNERRELPAIGCHFKIKF